jgi:hypothetical protein
VRRFSLDSNLNGVSSATAIIVVISILVVGIAAGLTVLNGGKTFHSSSTGTGPRPSSSSTISPTTSQSSSTSSSLSSFFTQDDSTSTSISSETSSSVVTSNSYSTTSESSTSSTSSSSSESNIIRANDSLYAGYDSLDYSGEVINVTGSWTVPSANCAGAPKDINDYPAAPVWIGISDGGTIEQIGTDTDCAYGSPNYFSWFEFYPSGPIFIDSVAPGDFMTAFVSSKLSSNPIYTLTIFDKTAGWTRTFTGNGGEPQQALWIVEQLHEPTIPLTDFGKVTFISSSMTQNSSGRIITGPITSNAAVREYTIIDGSGNVVAAPSNLSNDDTSFTVSWVSSGSP